MEQLGSSRCSTACCQHGQTVAEIGSCDRASTTSIKKILFMRILLVEDEPDLGAAIKRVLNQEKYVVDWVLDGTEAWEYLENYSLGFQPQTQYTLAILDWLRLCCKNFLKTELLAQLAHAQAATPKISDTNST